MHNLLSGRSVIESFAFCGSVSGADGVQAVRADQIGGDQRWPVMQANNEAFAPQVLAFLKGWGWSDDDSRHAMLNVNGRASRSAIPSALPAAAFLPTSSARCSAATYAMASKPCASEAVKVSQPCLKGHEQNA
jgi:hypothetical protein